MTSQFDKKERLIEALCEQKIVNNDREAAKQLAMHIQIEQHAKGDSVIQQGDLTDEMYFILSGKVEMLVNERHKAYREKGEAVGEMSLVDVGGARSATVVVNTSAVLARIEQENFTDIANNYPELWRNIAKSLSGRLRQRNDVERVRNSKPVIFIASSTPGKSIMDTIEKEISGDGFEVRPWTSDDLFEPSTHPIETLETMAKEVDFAIIILSGDDKLEKPRMFSPRDNVIFEQGMFVGGIGRRRTFVVECAPKQHTLSKLPIVGKMFECSLKIPSDFKELTVYRCKDKSQLPDICTEIMNDINRQGTI